MSRITESFEAKQKIKTTAAIFTLRPSAGQEGSQLADGSPGAVKGSCNWLV